MGRIKNTKITSGSKINKQFNFDNYRHDLKVQSVYIEYTKNKENHKIKTLEEAGVKFKKEDVIFVTKDKSGQLIWLEKGNNTVGLKHIINRHKKEFKQVFNVNENEIPIYLNKIITKGKIINTRITKRNGKDGYEKIYFYKGKYYVLVAVGLNGFIVSAYPINKEDI